MEHDFKTADTNHDGKLTQEEFKNLAEPLYDYKFGMKKYYESFKDTDTNHDGLIDMDEFSEICYVFTEDSFWDGYSIEEICVVEFKCADHNGDEYLNFTEYAKSMGY